MASTFKIIRIHLDFSLSVYREIQAQREDVSSFRLTSLKNIIPQSTRYQAMAYSEKEWNLVRSFYELGLSLNEIINRDEVVIKSKSQISKKATKECWQKETGKKQLVDLEVNTKQALEVLKEQKETLNETDIMAHDAMVWDKFKMQEAIGLFAFKAIDKANQLLGKTESASEFKAIIEGVDKLSITTNVNERHARTASTIIQNNSYDPYADMTDDDLRRELAKLEYLNDGGSR